MPIKNIIFDFGDVFINLDKPATQKLLDNFEIHQLDDETLSINNQYEQGLISTEAFINFYTTKYPKLTEKGFREAWNSILQDLPEYRLEFLQKLKASGRYKLFLLSNTNDLHIHWVKDNISNFEAFKACFDEFYLSHEIQLRKPNASIFQYVLEQNDLKAGDTLFIDDTLEHINSAKKLNLQTWHLHPGIDDVVDLFIQKQLNFD